MSDKNFDHPAFPIVQDLDNKFEACDLGFSKLEYMSMHFMAALLRSEDYFPPVSTEYLADIANYSISVARILLDQLEKETMQTPADSETHNSTAKPPDETVIRFAFRRIVSKVGANAKAPETPRLESREFAISVRCLAVKKCCLKSGRQLSFRARASSQSDGLNF